MEKLRNSIGSDLNAYNCPRGLDGDGVNRCTLAIQTETCGQPFDTLMRRQKCRTDAMCMK